MMFFQVLYKLYVQVNSGIFNLKSLLIMYTSSCTNDGHAHIQTMSSYKNAYNYSYIYTCIPTCTLSYSPYVFSRSLPTTLRYEPWSLSTFANTLILSADICLSTASRNMLTLSPVGIDGEQVMVEWMPCGTRHCEKDDETTAVMWESRAILMSL